MSASSASGDLELRVMSFNVWRSGGRSLEKTIEAIDGVRADIVGLQECNRETAETIARKLGFAWVDDDDGNVIVSRRPIVRVIGRTTDVWGGLGATIELAPRRLVHVFDAHLHWTDYGPWLLQERRPESFVIEQERATRMPGLNELLGMMASALASNEPTFLVGDFNAPSHLDYPATMAWPESVACQERGLADSYRVSHPERRTFDAARPFAFDEPGITWTPLTAEEPRGVFDRIDFVYYATNRQTCPTSSIELDGLNCVEPWPSDHRAVLSTFAIG